MHQASPTNAEQRRRNLWRAATGALVFAALGLIFAPEFATETTAPRLPSEPRRGAAEPIPAPPPAADGAQAARAAADPDARAFDCMIGPNEVFDIGSDVRGRIASLHVERGDYVEAGQVLAQLESGVEEAAVRAARARAERLVEIESSATNLALGEKRRERARRLFERNALSVDTRDEIEAKARLAALDLEQARENHRLAKIQLDQALADLERRTIRSPVAGFVVERLMSPGEVIDEETLLRVAQVEPLRVEAILPAEWFGRPQPGARVEVVPEAPLDTPREAEVTIVDPVLDGASGTFGVRMRLANPDRLVPAGMRCQVRFDAAPPRPLAEGAPAAPVLGPLAGS